MPQHQKRTSPPKKLKRLLALSIFLASFLILPGCEMPPIPDIDSDAAKLYIEKCSLCHPARHPQIMTYKKWVNQVNKMEKKVKNTKIREPLTEEEKGIILGYLEKYSRTKGF